MCVCVCARFACARCVLSFVAVHSKWPVVGCDDVVQTFSFRVRIALSIDDQRHHFNIVKVLLQVKIQPDYVTILLIFTPNKSIDLLSLNIVNELMQTIKILRQ